MKRREESVRLFQRFLQLGHLFVDVWVPVQGVCLDFWLQLRNAHLDVVELTREVFFAHCHERQEAGVIFKTYARLG